MGKIRHGSGVSTAIQDNMSTKYSLSLKITIPSLTIFNQTKHSILQIYTSIYNIYDINHLKLDLHKN